MSPIHRKRSWIPRFLPAAMGALLALAAIPGDTGAATHPGPVGAVNLIKTKAFERLEPADWNELRIKDKVFMNQWVRTPTNAALHVKFVDGTNLRLGANSEALIDEYVFDPAARTVKLTATLGKGVFRFISSKSGLLKTYDVKIRTPTATIGIRGTDLVIAVGEKVVVWMKRGHVQLTPCQVRQLPRSRDCPGGTPGTIGPGEGAQIALGGGVVQVASRPYDPGLEDDGGLASIAPGAGGAGGGPTLLIFDGRVRRSDNVEFVLPVEPGNTTSAVTPPTNSFDEN